MKEGVSTKKSSGDGTVTRKVVRKSATELVVINGRSAQDVSTSDWEQANWELTGGLDAESKAALLKSALEPKRWDPTPDTKGHKVPASPGENEDDEGRSDDGRLIEERIGAAEHDQMHQPPEKPQKRSMTTLTPTIAPPTDKIFEPENQPTPCTAEESAASQSLYALIAEQPFFKGMNPQQLRLLTESAMVMRFETGQEIFQEGDPANRFFLILEGKVVLETIVEERGVIQIQTLETGDDLGWSWLFPPYLFNVSARTLEPTRTIFFYGTQLREQSERDNALGCQLMQRVAAVLVQRLQATQKRLMESISTHQLSDLTTS